MIDKYFQYGEKFFVPVCDICEKELPRERDFEDAVASIRGEGWTTRKTHDGFKNYCPECSAALNDARREFED